MMTPVQVRSPGRPAPAEVRAGDSRITRALRRQFGRGCGKNRHAGGVKPTGGRLVQQEDFRLAEQGWRARHCRIRWMGADALARRLQNTDAGEQVAVARIAQPLEAGEKKASVSKPVMFGYSAVSGK